MGKDTDTSIVDSDDEWRSGSISRVQIKTRVIPRNEETDNDDTSKIKQYYTDVNTTYGFG